MTLFIKMFLFEEIPVYTLEFKSIEPKSIIPEDDAMKKKRKEGKTNRREENYGKIVSNANAYKNNIK